MGFDFNKKTKMVEESLSNVYKTYNEAADFGKNWALLDALTNGVAKVSSPFWKDKRKQLNELFIKYPRLGEEFKELTK